MYKFHTETKENIKRGKYQDEKWNYVRRKFRDYEKKEKREKKNKN